MLLSICSLLCDPNPDDPLVPEIARLVLIFSLIWWSESFSGSTRMMSASTWSVHGSGPKNMPCDSHPFQTSCNIMIINHSVQALFKPNPNCKTRFDPFPFCWVNKWPWPKNHKVILPMWGDKILDLRFLYAVHLCAPNPRDLASNVVVVLPQTVDQWLVL